MAVELHVVTPEREVFVGEVAMVVAHGVDGAVGILAGHAPLLVQLTVGPLRMQREDGTWEAAVVDGGFLHVSNDEGVTRADVLAADAQLAGEIDVEAARRRLDELSNAAGDDAEAQAEIARATARVTLAG